MDDGQRAEFHYGRRRRRRRTQRRKEDRQACCIDVRTLSEPPILSFEPIAFHRRALNGESVSYEYEFAGRFYDTHLEPLRAGGNIAGVIGVATDITDQKRATKYRDTQFVTTKILAESDTLHEAIVRFLEAICRGVDWDFGRMWQNEEGSDQIAPWRAVAEPEFHNREADCHFTDVSRSAMRCMYGCR